MGKALPFRPRPCGRCSSATPLSTPRQCSTEQCTLYNVEIKILSIVVHEILRNSFVNTEYEVLKDFRTKFVGSISVDKMLL